MPSSESSPKRLPRQEPGAGQLLAGKRPFFPSFTPEKTFVGPPSPVTTVLSCPQLSFGHVPYLSQLMFFSNSAQGLGDPQASDTVLPPGSSRSSPHSRRVRPRGEDASFCPAPVRDAGRTPSCFLVFPVRPPT